MYATEAAIFQALKKNLPQVHWQRVENSVGPGTPDVNYCYDGKEGWIELKCLGVMHIRKAQHIWLARRAKALGRCVLLIGTRSGDLIYIPGKCFLEYSKPVDYYALRQEYQMRAMGRGAYPTGGLPMEVIPKGPDQWTTLLDYLTL